MMTTATSTKEKASKEDVAKEEEETVENENEMAKSPPHGFNGNHEHTNEAEEDKEGSMDDLSILADAAANSPVPSVKSDTLQPSADIPFPSPEGGNDKSAEEGSKRPAVEQKQPSAKKAKKTPAKKSPSSAEAKPTKRSTRARKLPTKLQQRPSSMTSSSSAMSAAAILVQVSGSKKDVKPAKKPKKKPAEAGDSDIRGITMKRPGKWVRLFRAIDILYVMHSSYSHTLFRYLLFFLYSKRNSIMLDSLVILVFSPVKKRRHKPTRLFAKC